LVYTISQHHQHILRRTGKSNEQTNLFYKILINDGASLSLIMRNTFIKMGLNLKDLTSVHDTFHGVITGQSSTPIRRINLEVSCGTGDNNHKEVLTFEVARFDIGHNYILGRHSIASRYS
jgi:hypothetical protein